MPRSTRTGAERMTEDRQYAAAEQMRGDRSLVEGKPEAAVCQLADLERAGGLVRRSPPTPYDGGSR